VASEIIGVSQFRYKLLAFAVSSFYAGVAGALIAFCYLGAVQITEFELHKRVEPFFEGEETDWRVLVVCNTDLERSRFVAEPFHSTFKAYTKNNRDIFKRLCCVVDEMHNISAHYDKVNGLSCRTEDNIRKGGGYGD